MTLSQERPSQPIAGEEAMFFKQIGIDLGSQYAIQLGFGGIEPYKDDPAVDDAGKPGAGGGGGGKKKKKKRKKKKVSRGSRSWGKLLFCDTVYNSTIVWNSQMPVRGKETRIERPFNATDTHRNDVRVFCLISIIELQQIDVCCSNAVDAIF